jgi:hypothetical protein
VESSRVRALIARSPSKRDAPGNLRTAYTGTRRRQSPRNLRIPFSLV